MDETRLCFRRIGHRAGIAGSDLDEITKHVVVLDLQRLDAGFIGILQLQAGDHLARLVAQGTNLIQFCIGAISQESPVALQKRQVFGQHIAEQGLNRNRQRLQIDQRIGQFFRKH
ncbi:hypothetical protein D3C73_869670 [compost metagenome]